MIKKWNEVKVNVLITYFYVYYDNIIYSYCSQFSRAHIHITQFFKWEKKFSVLTKKWKNLCAYKIKLSLSQGHKIKQIYLHVKNYSIKSNNKNKNKKKNSIIYAECQLLYIYKPCKYINTSKVHLNKQSNKPKVIHINK